jgi:hypothetical protein
LWHHIVVVLLSHLKLNIQNYRFVESNEVNFLAAEHSTPQSLSYLTTNGQSASLSWYQATIWDLRPILLSPHGDCFQTFAV